MKILVPTDFSDLSLKAFEAANKYAELFDGKIYPMHSHIPVTEMDEPYALGMGSNVYHNYEEVEQSISERLQEIADENVDENKLGDIIVSMGNPAQAIITEAEGYDLIVLSTHGRTGFKRFLLGSVAEKVLRLAQIPVLVVEDESDLGDLKNILVTTDFSDNANAAYPHALDIAKKTGGNVTILHVLSTDYYDEDVDVDTKPDKNIKKIRDQRVKLIEKNYFHTLKDKVSSEVVWYDGSPHEAIYAHVKEKNYNLIVMSTVGRTGIKYLMLGSTTANVVRNVNTAVLSVRPPKQSTAKED